MSLLGSSFFFFKQKTAYEVRISDWSSDVCSSDLTDVFVVAETSNAIHSDRSQPLSRTPRLDEAAWQQFGGRLTAVADYLAGEGMRCAYHYHLGTVVERPEDLDRFLAVTAPHVWLTVDTGHALLAGIATIPATRRPPRPSAP